MSRRSSYICEICDYRSNNWMGRCPECETWGSLQEHTTDKKSAAALPRKAKPQPYPEINASPAVMRSTGLGELDRVLGGGLVGGAAILLGGEPGIGKSTLLLQAASALADAGETVLYVSGEESAAQLRLRGDRLGVSSARLLVLADTDVDGILEAAAAKPDAFAVNPDRVHLELGLTDIDGVGPLDPLHPFHDRERRQSAAIRRRVRPVEGIVLQFHPGSGTSGDDHPGGEQEKGGAAQKAVLDDGARRPETGSSR